MNFFSNAVPFVIVDPLARDLVNVAAPDPAIVTVEAVLDAIERFFLIFVIILNSFSYLNPAVRCHD